MHIAEGVLPAPVLLAGYGVTAAGLAVGLRKIEPHEIARVSAMSTLFFVASLIHVPTGVGSAHLILNGLVGLVLGWAAFPAIVVALGLQAVLFGFGGVTTLGVNTAIMAVPAVLCSILFLRPIRRAPHSRMFAFGFVAGALAVAASALLMAAVLLAAGREFAVTAKAVMLIHIPILVVEGLVTGSIATFLHRVRPELLENNQPAQTDVERQPAL